LVFGEYMPKSWFRSRPLERCRQFSGPLRLAEMIFKPVSIMVIGLTRLLAPGPQKTFGKPAPFVTREDLKILAREGEQDGVLSSRERVMIHHVFDLSKKKAKDIMVSKEQTEIVYSDTTIPEFCNVARGKKYTRMPVADRQTGEWVGVINLFNVLSSQCVDETRTVLDFARRPLFINEHTPVDKIFPRLRHARQPICFVTDDQDVLIGLITTEDILEEIVGAL
jgi:putative hemolysin